MRDGSSDNSIDRHYGKPLLLEKIKLAFVEAGFDLTRLSSKDLMRIDQLHMGGHRATLDLAHKVDISADHKVLDIGSGLGGTPRLLATEFGCHVTGVDLTKTFCEAAEELTRLVGLSDQVIALHADATNIPLPADQFDLIWCQHTQMNIKDKTGLIKEFSRLLKPGGKLAMHEVFKGSGDEPAYPVPWATEATASHLVPVEALVQLLVDDGYRLLHRMDVTNEALTWWQKLAAGMKAQNTSPSPLGPRLIFGESSRFFGPNVVRNLQQGAIEVHELVFEYSPFDSD